MAEKPLISPTVVLNIAKAEVGHHEKPTGSNKTKYGKAFGNNGVFWCGIFIWYVFNEAGIDIRQHGITLPASTNDFDAEAGGHDGMAAGWRKIDKKDVMAGDIVFYDFGVTGTGDPANDDDHIGLVMGKPKSAAIKAIEGNTHAEGESADDGVFVRNRALSIIRRAYRPPYAKWAAEQEAEADIVKPEDVKAIVTATVDGIWASKFKEFIDEDKDGVRELRTTADILYSTHAAALRSLAQSAALLAAIEKVMSTTTVVDGAALQAAAKAGAKAAIDELNIVQP